MRESNLDSSSRRPINLAFRGTSRLSSPDWRDDPPPGGFDCINTEEITTVKNSSSEHEDYTS